MINKKDLFEKKIDLNNCQINGGRMAASSNVVSTSTGPGSGCDVNTKVYDDFGNQLSSVTL